MVLVYLILVAQLRSYTDPILILLALPPGLNGVLLILHFTGTPINVMSWMGMLLVFGISVSDIILIVEFINRLRAEGRTLREAATLSLRVRLRPILMTTLATLIGLIPMGGEARHRQRSIRALGAGRDWRVGGSYGLGTLRFHG